MKEEKKYKVYEKKNYNCFMKIYFFVNLSGFPTS